MSESPKLLAIRDKVRSGERLSEEDGIALFLEPDLLAVGAARERGSREAPRRPHVLQSQHARRGDERLRRVVPVLLVRQARRAHAGRAHDEARGGLARARDAHERPGRAADRGARRQRPASGPAVLVLRGAPARLQAHRPDGAPQVLHRRGDPLLRAALRHDVRRGPREAPRGGPREPPGRRRGDLRRGRAPSHQPRQGDGRRIPRGPSRRASPRACARTRRCSTGTSRRSRIASITSCASVRSRTRRRGSRPSSRSRSIPTATA